MTGILASLLALPVVWMLGGKLELTQQGVAWAAVWLTVSTLLLMFAISPFVMWKKDKNAQEAEELSSQAKNRARLEVDAPRPHTSNRYHVWRANVINKGPVTAINAGIRLLSIEPPPRYAMWSADYPYPVQLVSADGSPQFECRISSGDTAQFSLMKGWPNGTGEFYTSGLDNRGGSYANNIRIEPSEEWLLNYKAVAENADQVSFSIRMFVKDGVVMMEGVSEPATQQPAVDP